MWPPLDYYAYAGLFNFFATGIITFFVISKKPESKLARLFCVFSAEVTIWVLFYFVWLKASERSEAEFFLRTCMLPVAFIPASFFHFVTELTQKRNMLWAHRLNYTLSGILALTVYTDLFAIGGAPPHLVFPYWLKPGLVFPIHMLQFLGMASIAHLLLLRAIRESSGLRRAQILMVFWGMLIAFSAGAMNYLQWYRTSITPVFMPLVSMLVFAMGYAIMRHKLLDIDVIVKRTVVFAGLVTSVVTVVSLVAFVSQDLLIRYVATPRWWSNIFAAIIIAAVYGRLRGWLTDATERYLFQKKYDYKELLKRFTDEVMAMVNLTELLQMTVKTLSETIKLDGCSLLLLNKDTQTYEFAASLGANGQVVALGEEEPLIVLLRHAHEPIGVDGVPAKARVPSVVTERMRQMHVRLCLPLRVHEDLIGVLCLGKKKSDEEFTKDDVDILMPLARTLGIAINNAQLFDELRDANAQLKAAMERLLRQERQATAGQIAAGMAHEIRNPLTAIRTFTELLPERYHDPEFRERCARIVPAEVERIVGLVQGLCNFARPAEPQVQPVALRPLIDDTIGLLSSRCVAQRVEVRVEGVEAWEVAEEWLVRADVQQLKQVLLNLCLNSLDAMPEGGRLTVSVRPQDERIVLRITDTGCGIVPGQLQRIWDPFFTTKTHGMGLGLAVVRQIVERNKGRISVESRVGKGTTFTLDFPAARLVAVPA